MIRPRLFAAALLLASVASRAAEQAPPLPSSTSGKDASAAAPATATADQGSTPDLGLALLAGGAGLLATTASAAVLLEALTTPDDNRNPRGNPELVQASGFVTLTLASLSAGVMLIGGALVLQEQRGESAAAATADPPGSP